MSSSNKSSRASSVDVSSTLAATSINPVPTNVSSPPEGWLDPGTIGRKGKRPHNGLPAVASTVATELRTNGAALSQELGPKAIDPTQLAMLLDLAHEWDTVDDKAATFRRYARTQRNATWEAAIKLMDGLRMGVRFAVARDPSFAERFPDVAKAFAPARRPKKKADAVATPAATPTAPAETAPKA